MVGKVGYRGKERENEGACFAGSSNETAVRGCCTCVGVLGASCFVGREKPALGFWGAAALDVGCRPLFVEEIL